MWTRLAAIITVFLLCACSADSERNPIVGKWELIDKRTAATCPSTLEVSEKLWRTNDGAQTFTFTRDGDSYIFTFPNARAPMIVKLGPDKTISLEAGLFKCQLKQIG
ncbi:MAG TPA: hypothetical protein VN838_28900 [Bradyrhizobium sp.]|nr:hypothetical protein [Bradyrhizobium sp.]